MLLGSFGLHALLIFVGSATEFAVWGGSFPSQKGGWVGALIKGAGLSLASLVLSIPGVLDKKVKLMVEPQIQEEQWGFYPERSPAGIRFGNPLTDRRL